MIKNMKIFKKTLALTMAGTLMLSSSNIVSAKEPNTYRIPSYDDVKDNGTSHVYVDMNGIVHKGKVPDGTMAAVSFENFGSNLISNGQKVLYEPKKKSERVSKNMYHLYMELNRDFGPDVMIKTYTEEDGIANLLIKLLDDGVALDEAMSFISMLDSNIYNGYGDDDFWYENVKDKDGNYIKDNKYIKNVPPKKEEQVPAQESNIQYIYVPVYIPVK